MATALSVVAAALPAFATYITAQAQTCPVISGFVYYDVNDNGIKEPGEPAIGGSLIQMHDDEGTLVAAASTESDGSYAFTFNAAPGTPTKTETFKATFAKEVTDWTANKTLPKFDTAKGALKSAELKVAAEIESSLKAESLDSDPTTITATVSGKVTVQAAGAPKVEAEINADAGSFNAAAFDQTIDFGGTSGHNFGTHTGEDSAAVKVTEAGALAAFLGPGTLAIQGAAKATSGTTGGGNMINEIHTSALAEVSVTYTYAPPSCLQGGKYTITQSPQPSGYGDKLETSGNQAPIPNTRGSDRISVTLSGANLPDNNFGELKSSLHGCVYVDADDDGVKDPGEAPITGVVITLTGAEDRAQTSGSDGCYDFRGLTGGTYIVTETQPPAYIDGKDTIGTLGGKTSNDKHFDIVLPPAKRSENNNFGEKLPTPAAPPPAPPAAPTTQPLTAPPTASSSAPSSLSGPGDPGVPFSGSGLLDRALNMNLIILGFAIFAASGWLAFLAMGREKGPDAEAEED